MTKRSINNLKLGVFVLSALFFLVLLLYMIGKNSNLFGNTYELKARFSNVQGLVVGNNVRYAGIETGTVKKIQILNDTVIEVTMIIEERMKSIIRKNSLVSIGTEGLVGNRVVNIFPSPRPQSFAEENDILVTQTSVDTDEMLQTLDETTTDIAEITEELKITLRKINDSTPLWSLLNDASIPLKIKSAISSINKASGNANTLVFNLNSLVADVKAGKGSVGALLTDTSYVQDIAEILDNLQTVSHESDSLIHKMDYLMEEIQLDIREGNGPINSILKDSILFIRIHSSLENIQNGTERFNQNMEALKHNFLFRGYFKKQDRQNRKLLEKKNEMQTAIDSGVGAKTN